VVTHRLTGHMKPRPRRRGVLCLCPRRGRWSSNHDGSLSGHSAMVSCCADPPSAGFTRPTFSSATCNPRGYAQSDTYKTLSSPAGFCVYGRPWRIISGHSATVPRSADPLSAGFTRVTSTPHRGRHLPCATGPIGGIYPLPDATMEGRLGPIGNACHMSVF
jgi:hypothetical protein